MFPIVLRKKYLIFGLQQVDCKDLTTLRDNIPR